MWLLNVHTLKLKAYLSTKDRPKYAILSHTWGEEEVLFSHVENLETPDLEKLKGYTKVKSSCLQARKDAYEWIWIDTCCINKDSSAELSEAINSMWAWYRHSDVCYAFLSDARKGKRDSIRASRWMKRGWTMQELIAPSQVRFFDMNWNELGDRLGMASLLSEVTRIDRSVLSRNQAPGHTHNIQAGVLCVLCGKPAEVERILDQISIASKMSWSARRETTRSEDRSYSLLGLFGVNMPLLYGEGGPSAWQRLQEEIIKKTYDQSILAFDNRQIYRLPGNEKILQP
ncbi:HET-domain-containing protein [Xylariaceae sp. FL0255]|nr:HET-domain-containing protein [Xylariaceae sp. FL0255]